MVLSQIDTKPDFEVNKEVSSFFNELYMGLCYNKAS